MHRQHIAVEFEFADFGMVDGLPFVPVVRDGGAFPQACEFGARCPRVSHRPQQREWTGRCRDRRRALPRTGRDLRRVGSSRRRLRRADRRAPRCAGQQRRHHRPAPRRPGLRRERRGHRPVDQRRRVRPRDPCVPATARARRRPPHHQRQQRYRLVRPLSRREPDRIARRHAALWSGQGRDQHAHRPVRAAAAQYPHQRRRPWHDRNRPQRRQGSSRSTTGPTPSLPTPSTNRAARPAPTCAPTP